VSVSLNNIKVRVSVAFLLAILVTLGGCVGGPPPQDHFYRFELPVPDITLNPPPLNGTLQVARPWADALTGERFLLYRKNNEASQVHRHAYHRWVDSPTLILQQEIARYLRASRIAEQVVTPELRVKVDYLLSCRIVRLERVLDDSPHVVMELELGLTRMKDRQALLLQSYHEEQKADGDGVVVSVVAYNQALSNILNRFLGDTSRLADAGKASANP